MNHQNKQAFHLSEDEMISFVRKHLELELNHDWQGVADTFHVHSGFLEMGGTKMEGRKSIAEYYSLLLSGIAEAKFDEMDVYCSGNKVFTTGTLSGVHTGFILGLPPTGKAFKIDLSAVFEFAQDGTLAYEKLYMDSHTFLHGLGFKFHPSNPVNLLFLYAELIFHPATLFRMFRYLIFRKRN